MADHNLIKAKSHALENFTLADSPLDLIIACSINREKFMNIRDTDGGSVMTFAEMIDNFEAVEASLKKRIAASYSLLEPSKIELNFLLTDLSIEDIQTIDGNASLLLGGSLAFPAIDHISHPLDDTDGVWRKIFDIDRPIAYVRGQQHSFCHPIKYDAMSRSHPLISNDSRTVEQVMYPNGHVVGVTGGPVHYSNRKDGSVKAEAVRPVLLHGHLINNENAYETTARPYVSQFLRPMGNDAAIQTEYHTHLPHGSYQHAWFKHRPELQKEFGSLVPMDEYTQCCYNFIEQVNSNRCTNFKHSGIWWNTEYLRDVDLKFSLRFRIVPIVENIHENADGVTFMNLRTHVRTLMEHRDRMNCT